MIGQIPFRSLSGTRILVSNDVRDGTISHYRILEKLGEGGPVLRNFHSKMDE